MSKRIVALIGLSLGPLVLILLDVIFAKNIEPGGFVYQLKIAGRFCTFISWPAGVLMGHWYHPVDNLRAIIKTPWNYITLGIISIVIFTLGAVLLYGFDISYPQWITVLVSLVAGSLLWPV
ncbi:MAG: hypothetical protein ACMUIL_03425 [bacterium]